MSINLPLFLQQIKRKQEVENIQLKVKDMSAIHLNKAGFLRRIHNYEVDGNNWKFQGSRPALIDFYATWCGPCKALSPVIDELADEYAGKVDIYKVNVDEEQELSALFNVRSIPTLVFINTDSLPQASMGGRSKEDLKRMLDQLK